MKRIALIAALSLTVSFASAQDKLYHNTFNLNQVELLDGPFKHAMDLNVKVLLEYDTDRLLAPYLKEAGLPKKAELFPNWEGLDGNITPVTRCYLCSISNCIQTIYGLFCTAVSFPVYKDNVTACGVCMPRYTVNFSCSCWNKQLNGRSQLINGFWFIAHTLTPRTHCKLCYSFVEVR